MTRDPSGVVDGMSLRYYHAGETYDIPSGLAEYLVAAGYASVEMRQQHQRSSRPRKHERRRTAPRG